MKKTSIYFIMYFCSLATLQGQIEQQNFPGSKEINNKRATFNLEELKVRWKKAALENCPGVPCVTNSVPGEVTNVVVTDGLEEGEVIVTFTPPLSDGGSPITEYEVEATEESAGVNSPTISSYSLKSVLVENITITSNDIPLTLAENTNEPVSGFVVSSIIRAKGSKSPITVKGLKVGVSYIFRVIAKNIFGSSPPPPNNKSNKITPKVFTCAAGIASSTPTLIKNTPLTNITHTTIKATGIGNATGLPQGVTAAWSGNMITIKGTPSETGVFNYVIPLSGTLCNAISAKGTITVEAACEVGKPSLNPSLTENTPLKPLITIETTGALGIGSATGLPDGVTAAWSGNIITISGTPLNKGVFSYTIPVTGSICNNVNATGTITVTPFVCGATSITDIDNNPYKTVLIGTQCWTAENLRTRKYNDGTNIFFDNTGGVAGNGGFPKPWSSSSRGAHTIYAHDSTASTGNLAIYGYLYNWFAVKGIASKGSTDYKNICPKGWHIPSDSDWSKLLKLMDSGADTSATAPIRSATAGRKMKSTGTDYWSLQSLGTDNSSGFSALPGGYRESGASFSNIRINALFWSSNEKDSNFAWYYVLYSDNGDVYRSANNKLFGGSVRCLRD
jgi:uncharacterized protein (TIGR02145 family)